MYIFKSVQIYFFTPKGGGRRKVPPKYASDNLTPVISPSMILDFTALQSFLHPRLMYIGDILILGLTTQVGLLLCAPYEIMW